MKPPLILVHYHLRPGGVARVIDSLSRALTRRGHPHVILCGDPAGAANDLPVRSIPGLDYPAPEIAPARLHRALTRAAAAAFPGTPPNTLCWHFHNPMLGKNPALTVAVARLAEDRRALILQHHDFAEDGRPAQWQELARLPTIYPTAPRILHATVNTRDRDHLIAAGFPAEQTALFANPVESPTARPADEITDDAGEPLVFLPARGIRRKNLGELLLLAALAPGPTRFAVSRAPDRTSGARAIHDHWRTLADELGLGIEFAVSDRRPPRPGESADFDSWCRAATHFLSCAVAEGFGYTFFEGPARGLPVFGRCPPAIAADLPAALRAPLYRRLEIPAAWLDTDALDAARATARHRLAAEFGLEETAADPAARDDPRREPAGRLDFGNLPEAFQAAAIHRARAAPEAPRAVLGDGAELPLRDYLAEQLAERTPPPVDLAPFAPDTCAAELVERAAALVAADTAPPSWLPRRALLERFLPDFHFPRS
jgi:glycosyltransferase involved in cell wall biosynthesis